MKIRRIAFSTLGALMLLTALVTVARRAAGISPLVSRSIGHPPKLIEELRSTSDGLAFSLNVGAVSIDARGAVQAPRLNGRITLPGAPALPYYWTLIALPPEAHPEVEIWAEGFNSLSARDVLPAAVPSTAAGVSPEDDAFAAVLNEDLAYEPDPGIYEGNTLFPEANFELSEIMYLRDLRVVKLSLYPLRFDPQDLLLLVDERLEVRISYVGADWSSLSALQSAAANPVADHILNLELAGDWKSLPAGMIAPETALPIGVDVYKIEVDADGIYELSYADLAAAGMSVDQVDPGSFEMLYRGQPVAYEFVGDADPQFEPGESVRFYGWRFDGSRLEKQFFVNNVYWLWAGGTARRISNTVSLTGLPLAESFLSSVTREPENRWFATWTDDWDSFPNEPDAWYWKRIRKQNTSLPITETFTVSLPFPASAGPDAIFTAEFSSKPNPDAARPHDVAVHMNSSVYTGSLTWQGTKNVNISGSIPVSQVISGTNAFHVLVGTDAAGTAVDIYLNSITVDYQRLFVAADDQLVFSDEIGGPREFTIAGFSLANQPGVLAWNVSDRTNPVAITGSSVAGTGPYSITFGSSHAAGAEFVVTTISNTIPPLALSRYVPESLVPPSGGADWVAISHRDFLTETHRLAIHRESLSFGGYSTHVVDAEDIINQHGYGLPVPAAIQGFLTNALANWTVAPSYLLLVGDATVNPRDNLNVGLPFSETQYLLTDLVFVDRFQGQIPSDFVFTLLSGSDLLPDIAVGRIPAKTVTETAAAIDKIILFEQNQFLPAGWMHNMLFVSDDPDQAGDFCAENQLIGDHIPDTFEQTHLCLPMNPTAGDVEMLRSKFFTRTNFSGTVLINYRGHGGLADWGGSPQPIMSVHPSYNHQALWNNPVRPPVILTGDCLDGYFIYPLGQGLGETFFRLTGNGTAAHWSSTGLGLSFEHSALVERFYRGLFNVGLTAIGDAANFAKTEFILDGGHPSLGYSFLLQGDPAMQLYRPSIGLEKTSLQMEVDHGEQAQFVITVTNDGVFPSHLVISDTLPEGLDYHSFQSTISASVSTIGREISLTLQFGSDRLNRGLPRGSEAIITMTVTADAAANHGVVTNLAAARATGLEIWPGNESDTAVIEILQAFQSVLLPIVLGA